MKENSKNSKKYILQRFKKIFPVEEELLPPNWILHINSPHLKMETENVPEHPAFRTTHPRKNMFEYIMITLTVFTAIELILSYLYTDSGTLSLEDAAVLLLTFAVVKAILVAGYFMHMFYEKKLFLIFLVSFVFPILLALPLQ
jgi:caa(3)-type oxidase subunit IV